MSALILKLIAALSMAIDHTGLILFGNEMWMRAIGRIAFPLFAFFIAEGFRYTRNRLRYLFGIFSLGVFCQIFASAFAGEDMLNILITFSLSILLLFLLTESKTDIRYLFLFGSALIAVLIFTEHVSVDYGFCGVILPLFPALFEKKWARLASFSAGLLLLCTESTLSGGHELQWLCLLALIPLALYNGKRGKYSIKYFFYIFYPVHLSVLYGIDYFF